MLSLFWEAGACSRHSSPVIFRKTMCEIALAAPVSHCVLFLTGIVFDSLFALDVFYRLSLLGFFLPFSLIDGGIYPEYLYFCSNTRNPVRYY